MAQKVSLKILFFCESVGQVYLAILPAEVRALRGKKKVLIMGTKGIRAEIGS